MEIKEYHKVPKLIEHYRELLVKAQKEQKKKKKKVAITISSISGVVAVAIIMVILALLIFVPSSNYDKAIELINAGKYDEAISIFSNEGKYSDYDKQIEMSKAGKLLNEAVDMNNIELAIDKVCGIGGTVIINYTADDGGIVEKSSQTITSTDYEFATCSWDHYYFDKWVYVDHKIETSTDSYSCNITLKAVHNYKTYTINFYRDLNHEDCYTDQYTVKDIVTIKNPKTKGYTFIGWSCEGSDQLILDFNLDGYSIGGDKTYYSNWQINEYSITFENSDTLKGTIENTSYKAEYKSEISMISTAPKDGYMFAGWNIYKGSSLVKNNYRQSKYTISDDDYRFVAQWNTDTSDILRNIEGVGELSCVRGIDGKRVITSSNYLGYEWDGWYVNDQFSTNETSIKIEKDNSDDKYEARWKVSNDMIMFDFASTATTCSIISIKDEYKSATSILIPSCVTSIKDKAFSVCSSLESITLTSMCDSRFVYFFEKDIPTTLKTVTVLGGYIPLLAFYKCSGLTSITLGEKVTSIGTEAFYGCSGLLSIEIPSGVTSIGSSAFCGCSGLTSITLGEKVTSIGSKAFYRCSSFTSIEIPSGVTSIGEDAFDGCSSIKNVYVASIESWCKINFYNGLSNPLCCSASLYINGELQEELEIPDSVTSIGKYAFFGCSSLTSIEIPSGVTSIGSQAFDGCSSIKNVYVTSIESWCQINFYDVQSNPLYNSASLYINGELQEELEIPDSVTSIGKYAFYECSGLTSVTLGEKVTSIGSCAFYGCSGLTSVEIPSGVTSIGDSAFAYCTKLTSITIPNSVTSIGESAFSNCIGLKNISIDNGVTSIGKYAFYGCSGLTNIEIPNSVTSIGERTFDRCSGLTSITIPFVGNRAGVTSSDTYQYPFGYIFGTYGYTGGTSTYQSYYGSSTSSTTSSTYYIPSTLKSVTVLGGYIPYGAFMNCYMITSVTLGEKVTDIDSYAFYHCYNLKKVYNNSSLEIVKGSTDYGCVAYYADEVIVPSEE